MPPGAPAADRPKKLVRGDREAKRLGAPRAYVPLHRAGERSEVGAAGSDAVDAPPRGRQLARLRLPSHFATRLWRWSQPPKHSARPRPPDAMAGAVTNFTSLAERVGGAPGCWRRVREKPEGFRHRRLRDRASTCSRKLDGSWPHIRGPSTNAGGPDDRGDRFRAWSGHLLGAVPPPQLQRWWSGHPRAGPSASMATVGNGGARAVDPHVGPRSHRSPSRVAETCCWCSPRPAVVHDDLESHRRGLVARRAPRVLSALAGTPSGPVMRIRGRPGSAGAMDAAHPAPPRRSSPRVAFRALVAAPPAARNTCVSAISAAT